MNCAIMLDQVGIAVSVVLGWDELGRKTEVQVSIKGFTITKQFVAATAAQTEIWDNRMYF